MIKVNPWVSHEPSVFYAELHNQTELTLSKWIPWWDFNQKRRLQSQWMIKCIMQHMLQFSVEVREVFLKGWEVSPLHPAVCRADIWSYMSSSDFDQIFNSVFCLLSMFAKCFIYAVQQEIMQNKNGIYSAYRFDWFVNMLSVHNIATKSALLYLYQRKSQLLFIA